jgi:hypothetical protein
MSSSAFSWGSFGGKGYYFAPLEAYNRHENTEGADNMGLAIDKDLETKIRARAEAEGLTVEAYLRRLVRTDQETVKELETLALEGLRSGAPFEVGPSYWQEKHRLLDERLSKTNSRLAVATSFVRRPTATSTSKLITWPPKRLLKSATDFSWRRLRRLGCWPQIQSWDGTPG